MKHVEAFGDKLAEAFKEHNADYIEAHLEERQVKPHYLPGEGAGIYW